ncbi:MAG: response regulator [Bacteroidota bacterium]|nr:response regulator [Bacteroidota bacterium]
MVILLVEDNKSDIVLISSILKDVDRKCELHVINNGAEAIMFLKKDMTYIDAPTPDLVILDLNLPMVHGIEVLAKIKGDILLSSIPLVVFTSVISEKQRDFSIALGCDEYFEKPMIIDDYVRIVKSFFQYGSVKYSKFEIN